MFTYTKMIVAHKLNRCLPFWGVAIPLWLAQVSFVSAIAIQICASVMFILGLNAQLMARILLGWLLCITVTVHNFWTITDDSVPGYMLTTARSLKKGAKPTRPVGIPTFPTKYDNEFVHFFKNVCTLGGFVLFIEGGL